MPFNLAIQAMGDLGGPRGEATGRAAYGRARASLGGWPTSCRIRISLIAPSCASGWWDTAPYSIKIMQPTLRGPLTLYALYQIVIIWTVLSGLLLSAFSQAANALSSITRRLSVTTLPGE
eukprot:1161049-Pelagomonas_calceolata.AAC.3